MECIVHYPNQSSYSEIKTLSEVNIQRIREANSKRNEIGGNNNHLDQCQQIPEEFCLLQHGVHLEPCYKRYDCFFFIQHNSCYFKGPCRKDKQNYIQW